MYSTYTTYVTQEVLKEGQMEIGLLLLWLLVGMDIAGDGPWTAAGPTPTSDGVLTKMDGPTLPPPPQG